MAIQVILNQAGPLPITATFNAPSDEPMYLEISGSVWSQTEGQLLGIVATLDDNEVGAAQIYSNGATTHRATVPGYIQVQLSEGQHTLTLSVAGNSTTVSDFNDFYAAVLHY